MQCSAIACRKHGSGQQGVKIYELTSNNTFTQSSWDRDEVGSIVVSRGGGLRVIAVGSGVPGEGMVGINADASESWSSC